MIKVAKKVAGDWGVWYVKDGARHLLDARDRKWEAEELKELYERIGFDRFRGIYHV